MNQRFAEYIKFNKNLESRTLERYIYILEKIPEEVFNSIKTKDDVFKLRVWIDEHDGRDGYSFRTNGHLTKYAIRSYLKFLNKVDILPYLTLLNLHTKKRSKDFKHWPADIITMIINKAKYKVTYLTQVRDDVLPIDTFKDKWAVIPKEPFSGDRDTLFIKFLFQTGARCREALLVTYDAIDKKRRRVVLKGKGGYSREALVTQELLNDIEIYLQRWKIGRRKRLFDFNPEIDKDSKKLAEYINHFGEKDGKALYMEIRQITKAEYMVERVGKLCMQSNRTVTPHQMRHSLAMLLRGQHVPLDEIQKVLGHSDISTTQIYAKTTLEDVEAKYNDVLGAKSGEFKK